MKNDGKIERFRATAAKRTAEYQSLMSVVTSVYDEIQGELDAGVPMEVVTEDLRNDFEMEITNERSVETCMYRIRKKRKSEANTSSSRTSETKTVSQAERTEPKNPAKPKPRKKPGKPDYEECPYIQKIEAHLGERLPDSVRPFVEIRDGGLITHFEKGTIHTAEIREFTTRIRRLCDRNLI